MPGTTPRQGFRYPLATEAPDGPGAFLALATDLDNLILDASPFGGTGGTISNGTGMASYSAANYTRARRTMGAVVFHLGVFLNGVAVTANLAVATLPVGMRPTFEVIFQAVPYVGNFGQSGVANMSISTDGTVRWLGGTSPGSGGSLVGSVTFAAA